MNLKKHLEELFKQCEHGDDQHRKWLKDKFNDYINQAKDSDDTEESESSFVDKLIEELPEHGIDTSKWEYEYGDCCDDSVEFIARCINGIKQYAKESHQFQQEQKQGAVWVKASERLPDEGRAYNLKYNGFPDLGLYDSATQEFYSDVTKYYKLSKSLIEWLDETHIPEKGYSERLLQGFLNAYEIIKYDINPDLIEKTKKHLATYPETHIPEKGSTTTITKEIQDKIDAAQNEFCNKESPLESINNKTSDKELTIIANLRLGMQIGFNAGATFGYNLCTENNL